ncbi:MAG: sodium:proton antiporter, partial [Bdellovibrionales bacterium]|nr:sodium:proton antiporter [Bdellovibrionales bacterium]
ALLSPTDPIAVLALLKDSKAPQALSTKIAGESLFNDGTGVVLFLVILQAIGSGNGIEPLHVLSLFLRETVGGTFLGLAFGYLAFRLLKSIDNYSVEALLTLALVTGGYSVAHLLHVSGPIAMVLAGLLIGNRGRLFAMSERTRENLDTFWILIDETLVAVLFVLLGMEVLVVPFEWVPFGVGLLAIPVVLAVRFISVGAPLNILRRYHEFGPNTAKIMTWGGLKGGISVALVLSLPASPIRDTLLLVTYVVVVFSVVVQGLTFPAFIRRFPPA